MCKHVLVWLTMNQAKTQLTMISEVLNSPRIRTLFIGKLKAIRTTGSDEEATTALSHIATSPDYTWGTGKNNRRFAFLVTDEDIDLTPKTPTKDATLKPFKMLGFL